MTNLKSNLRKMATIIACLTVATMFASCGGNKDNDDDGNGGGKIDTKLVGNWTYTSSVSTIWTWIFVKDGTFHFHLTSSAEYSYKGKYSVSDGKIYFTNVVFTNAASTPVYKKDEPDSWVDYVIERDTHGDLLKIDNTGKSFTGSPWLRRQ